MDRVLKIRFNDSKEEIKLYNWLITHENMEDFAKEILIKEMNRDLNKNTRELNFNLKRYGMTKEEISEIASKARELFK